MKMKKIETINTEVEPIKKPIPLEVLQKKTKERVLSLQPSFVFSPQMLEVFQHYGAAYNQCVHNNTTKQKPERIIVPAPTGSAKTTSAKVYLSEMALKGLSGLLVVGKVADAIKAVEEINEMAGKKVAVCTYVINKEKPDNDARVDINQLNKYLIAVITHGMFESRSASEKDIELIRDYNTKNRQAIIIDEHIDFIKSTSFSSSDLLEASALVNGIRSWSTVTEELMRILEAKPSNEAMSVTLGNDTVKIMYNGIKMLEAGNGYVGLKKDLKRQDRENSDRQWVIDLLRTVAYVASKKNLVVRQGNYNIFSANEDLTNKFGSVVVLDATAEFTPLYTAHAANRKDIQLGELPKDIRNYSNVTLHICTDKNRKQSFNKIYNIPKQKGELDLIIDSYLEELYPLVADGSKLLVVTFMKVEELFRTRCKDDNITFIHWGEHEGRNDFANYKKAVVIGWFRKPKNKYYQDIDAIKEDTSTYIPLSTSIGIDVIDMINGGIATDIIQFFNRTRSRIVIDKSGNCKSTDFYLFDDGSSPDLIELIQEAMPKIKTKQWIPVKSYPIVKSTAADQRAERIVAWLQKKKGYTMSQKTIMDDFGFSKQKLNTTFNSSLFKLLLEDAEIEKRIIKGRGGGIYFDVPK